MKQKLEEQRKENKKVMNEANKKLYERMKER